jgi:hypothetical protein
MVPSVRWFLRQRTNRVIEEINTRLPIEIPQFNLTRRQVPIVWPIDGLSWNRPGRPHQKTLAHRYPTHVL